MKKLLLILFAILLIGAIVPDAKAQVYSVTDQVDGVESVYIPISATGKYSAISFDVLFTQVGGTTDGWVSLMAKNTGGTFQKLPLAQWGDWINYTSTLDTLQITNGATWKVEIQNPAFTDYQIRVKGTAGDTTSVTVKYTFKKY